PEPKHVGGVNAEFRNFRSIRRDSYKMLRNRLFVTAKSRDRPGTGSLRIRHRFQSGKGFGRDDEQSFRRIKVLSGFGKISSVHVGDETEAHGPVAVMTQGFVGHDRTGV